VAHSRSLAAHAVHYCVSYSMLLHRRISDPSISFVMRFFIRLSCLLGLPCSGNTLLQVLIEKEERERERERLRGGNGTPRFPVQPTKKRHVLSRSCSTNTRDEDPVKICVLFFFLLCLEEQTKCQVPEMSSSCCLCLALPLVSSPGGHLHLLQSCLTSKQEHR
jgi:hypothetical protein